MQPQEAESNEERWPSVGLAYEFVRPSYEQVARRIEAQENRIRATITFATTITFAALTFLTAQLSKKDFASPWFLAAISAFTLLMALGVVANIFEETRLVDPNKLYETMLDLSEWEFKKDALAIAGADFKANSSTVDRLGAIATLMAVLMAAEVIGLIVWAAQTTSNAAAAT